MESALIAPEESKRLLLAMSQQQSVAAVLRELVVGLHERCGAALARAWLVTPTTQCDACSEPRLCREQPHCLRLVASAGRSLNGTDWSSIDGEFARIPLGAGKVGFIAQTGRAVEEPAIDPHSPWIANPEWVRKDRIRGLIGQPLLYQGTVLGVLAVFTREAASAEDLSWLRAFADHAAAAVANSRAFEEIQRLRAQLESENEYLRSEVREVNTFGDLVGESPAFRNAMQRVELVAPTDATVLIEGESGAGKELIARAIHEASRRSQRPLITVNCAAIPPELFESEFFGHVQGAFSSATRDRMGRFSLADGGTLLLDEVGEIPLAMHGKLLRVLEQGTFERVGDDQTHRVDVRILAATNRSLVDDVAAGRFRKDLFYRLNVFSIEVVPLRERKEDLRLLAEHFMAYYSQKYRVKTPPLSRRQLGQFEAYSWPGNVRELRNVVERAIIMLTQGGTGLHFALHADDVAPLAPSPAYAAEQPLLTDAQLREMERNNLIAVLQQTRWKISGAGGAAEFLGLNPATLASRLRALGIARSSQAASDAAENSE